MNQRATQIVKVNINTEKKKRKRVKRAKKKATTGTGQQPFLGTPQYGQVPIPAPFSRQGWTLEPVIAKQVEQPPIQRIEQQPQMNLVLPPREIRDYMGRMLESQFNVNGRSRPIIEEMPTAPPSPSGRVEKPLSPLLPSQQPPPLVLPPAVKIEEEKKREEPPSPELIFIDEKNPKHYRTAEDLQALRNQGKINQAFLKQFVLRKSKAGDGESSIEQITLALGLPFTSKVSSNKEKAIAYILENI